MEIHDFHPIYTKWKSVPAMKAYVEVEVKILAYLLSMMVTELHASVNSS
jgi:hypothetical protein